MRIFLAGVSHETSSFSPIPTNRDSFANWQMWRPKEGPPADSVDLLGYGEVLRIGAEAGHTMLPGLFAAAMPSAPMSETEWRALKGEVLADLEAAMPVDAVFLFLHGAQSAIGVDECEGDLVEAVRRVVGRAPIAVELDLHGNVTRRLLEQADLVCACKEYPHTDFAEVGARVFDLLCATARGEIAPRMAAFRVPAFGVYLTMEDPMQSIVSRLRELESRPGVLLASALHGFYGSDHPGAGGSAIVITDGNDALADSLAGELAEELLSAMLRVPQTGPDIDELLDRVEEATATPVVIGDCGDNPGAGAPGDSTFLLRRIFERGIRDVAVGMIWDPVAVELAHAAGVGATLDLRIGGKVSPMSGDPIDANVRVTSVRQDARQALFGGDFLSQELGKSAAVHVNGVDIVLNSVRQQVMSTHCFSEHGIDVSKLRAVVVKSTRHFYASFLALAGAILYCNSPGAASIDMRRLPYRRVARPLYPLDTAGLKPLRLTVDTSKCDR